MAEPVRLQEIADLVMVSRATVSRALRSDPRISKATRELVQQAAVKLHYTPDPVISRWAGRAWKKRRSLRSGYEIAFISEKNIPEKSAKHAAARHRAAELGYSLQFYSLQRLGNWKRVNQIIRAKSIPGVLLDLWSRDSPVDLDGENISVVCCGVGGQELPYHTVHLNTFRQMEITWQKAIERGRKRALIWLQEAQDSLHGRLHYGAALECERRFKPGLAIACTQFGWVDQKTFVRMVLRSKADVIISVVTNEAFEIMQPLRKKGWQGEWLVLRSQAGCGISGLAIHDSDIARESVNLLDRLIRDYVKGQPPSPLSILVSPVWNEEKNPDGK